MGCPLLSLQPALTLPYAGIWKVGLEKADEKIWFNDCWQEFMEYRSICSGHLLVFGYERNSNFHDVLIFYPTFTEIQNPSSKNYKLELESSSLNYVPAGFAKNYIGSDQTVKIQTSDKKHWSFQCNYHHGASKVMRMGNGWSAFSKDNNLQEGDVIVFEVIKRMPIVLGISIFT
ncbi:b3 domain-containing transcription factor vrn1 [Quercus suber]|uniref:B3 domain-containing transcription factor vrn1 n=1 Tax=Quercus suber TaxID=58331 RepID=A0AAW0KIK9_QUESU